ncbi:hypothetical protein HELRODRAFT_96459 [Helobdella robusta]|uniref:EF-hand domain-containing protein n=1 Tax=Helobdella robusta TaxID=6412 RepID=T1G9C2_HELRO|nr:hypothetical protein HELRODRAFT_96459 [Helobdella robusta]ESN90305.1 hypothetical protein HELRODRAFT_96459 [Helobdella robusta]
MSTSTPKAKKRGRMTKAHRYTSNVFSMLNQVQIQEFKEAFNMIDQNRDGFIDKEDLIEVLTSLGKNPSDDQLDSMLQEAPGPINFTMFLTLFGEKLNGTDPDDVITNAFACFDEKNNGSVPEERLRVAMTTMGDRWTDEMVDDLFHYAPIDEGNFYYGKFIKVIKHGSADEQNDPLSEVNK